MSATNAPFGFRPVQMVPGTAPQLQAYEGGLASGAALTLFKGTPIAFDTSGRLTIAPDTGALAGVFDSVFFIDASGVPQNQNFWVSGTVALANTAITVYWIDGRDQLCEVQAAGSIPLTSIYANADLEAATKTAGSTLSGISGARLSTTVAATNAAAQWRIMGVAPGRGASNAVGDAFTIVQVRLNQYQAAPGGNSV
jgi:hypothetical protein